MTATEHTDVPIFDPTIPPELANHPRYRVLNQLGAGGMGMVYKAEHVMMGRTVAVKVMAQKYTANRTAVERFRREVRAAAKLAHPNIVTAFDADEADGRHFLVMEYVEGVSLDRVVNRRGPLPVTTACHVVRLVALGLQHAHSKGMIHRDIKPQNVMVNRKSQVKVLDFGLARLATDTDLPSEGDATAPQNVAVTSTNMVMGTPDYLSPEQAKCSRDIDHRSDIYSLGCLFYFALTGRPPFVTAVTAFDKVLAHTCETPPPITEYRADVPAEVVAIVMKMLAKDPAERYATAAEVATVLLPFTKPSTANTGGLTVIPLVEAVPVMDAIPLFDFEVVDEPAKPESETVVATHPTPPPPKKLKKLAKKPRRNWKKYAGLAAVLLGFVILLGVIGSQNPTDEKPDVPPPVAQPKAILAAKPTTGNARVLITVPKRGLAFDEYEPVKARLTELGATVTTAATTRGPSGLMGLENRPKPIADVALSELNGDDFDAIVFPGMDTTDLTWREGGSATSRLLRTMNEAKKVISAINHGQRVLLENELLRGRKAAPPADAVPQRMIARFGVEWNAWRGVVTDGHFITASGPADAKAFADAIYAMMQQSK